MKKPIYVFSMTLLFILLMKSGFVSCAQTTENTERSVGILSQTLVDFTGKSQNNTILISWKTLSKTDNVLFIIQRSKDGSEWEDLGKLNGSMTEPNSFSFTDTHPLEAVSYYRLKMDRDSKSEFSSLITVKYVIETNKTMLYPNPTKNVIWIKSEEEASTRDIIDLEVYDILGERVYASKMEPGNLQKLDMSSLQNGYYSVKIGNQTYKVLKQ
jgi:hypothetical protein